MLRRQGWSVTLAVNGAEACRCYLESRFDLVLMDVQMPEMDGLEATRRIRAEELRRGLVRTPILALTAHASRSHLEQCLAEGMDAMITKPVNLPALLLEMRPRWNAASSPNSGSNPKAQAKAGTWKPNCSSPISAGPFPRIIARMVRRGDMRAVRQVAGAFISTLRGLPRTVPRIGLALGGGFARGIAHAGVLEVFEKNQIPIHCITGVSAGSIVAAAYASGATPEEISQAGCRMRFGDVGSWTICRMGFLASERMKRFLERLLKRYTFEEMRIPLGVLATDLLPDSL